MEPDLEALHLRLSTVTITCMDYAAFLSRVDRERTLFYLDPPYWGCEDDYGKGLFNRADFDRMAGHLATLKGRFLMSINDVPEIRKTFAAFHIAEVKTTYTITTGPSRSKERAELIISNFEWDEHKR